MSALAPMTVVPRARLVRAWDVYREVHFPELAKKTRQEYASSMRLALRELPELLRAADVLRWHRRSLAERYSTVYANQCLHVLRGVVRRAALLTGDQELVSVVWQTQPLRDPPTNVTAPPMDLVRLALALCTTPAERLFVRLAGIAGLRRSEILGLQHRDWDSSYKVLRIVRQRNTPHRKNRRQHRVSVTDEAFQADIEWCIEHHAALWARSGWFRNTRELWLIPWSRRRAENLMRRLRQGLPHGYIPRGRGWHLFRHWGATQLARHGASVWDVMRWLGDASAKMATWYVDTHGAANCDAVGTLTATAVLADNATHKVGPEGARTPSGPNPSSRATPLIPGDVDRGAPTLKEVSDEEDLRPEPH